MGALEIWSEKGWQDKSSINDLKPGDVFRLSFDGVVGAALIAVSNASESASNHGESGMSITGKVLNQAASSFCNSCGGIFEASDHSDDCPRCGGNLNVGGGFNVKKRLVVEPNEVDLPEEIKFH